MIDVRTVPYAATVLRLALGILFLAHAGAKLFIFTPAGTAQYFGSLGLPPSLAHVIIGWEIIGGIGLLLGVYSRAIAVAMIPELLGTIYFVHGSAGFFFTNPRGGWEFPALWIVGLVALALIGDGAYALRPTSSVSTHPTPTT